MRKPRIPSGQLELPLSMAQAALPPVANVAAAAAPLPSAAAAPNALAGAVGAARPAPSLSSSPAPVAASGAPAASRAEPARSGLRVIQGGGERRREPLSTRDSVVRVLVEAGADLLLRRISVERAEHIERTVNQILELFDRVDAVPQLMPVLQRQLEELEALMTQTRELRSRRPG